jgi:F-type H+-transporting ATPase subunit delta
MHVTKAAIRYARSLFSLSVERNELSAVHDDMSLIGQTIRENRDFALMLKNPIIKADAKEAVIKSVFGSKIGKTSAAFIDLIVHKRREMHIQEIVRHFEVLYLEYKGIVEAMLITAYKIDEPFRTKIIQLIEQKTGNKVELHEKIDASIIGGFILRFGDNQIDTSVELELEMLRQEFNKNLYVKEKISHKLITK